MTAQTLLRDLLRDAIAPLLRMHGFAGSGQDFGRRIDHDWAVLNVQKDKYSTVKEVRFTFNLGVACPYALVEDGIDPEVAPREIFSHFRTRIGSVLPSRRDTWWTISSRMTDVDVAALASTLTRLLEDSAIPALVRMADHDAIIIEHTPSGGFRDLSPMQMDVIGPILREVGSPDRFAAYLAAIDASPPATDVYAIFFDYRRRPGNAGIAKALERLGSSNWDRRAEALRALSAAAVPNEDLLKAMRPSLDDVDRFVREAAVGSLGRLGDVASLDRMVSMIHDEPARSTVCAAAIAVSDLSPRLSADQRSRASAGLRRRHERAVGHDRPILGSLIGVFEMPG